VTAHHAHPCPELPASPENLKLQEASPLPGRTGHCPSRPGGCRARQLPGARKGASASPAPAPIRSVILPPSQVAKHVSSIAPTRNSTISSPLSPSTDRCQAEMPHSKRSYLSSRTATDKDGHAAERVGWLDSTGQ
jgi:hypothetical protein